MIWKYILFLLSLSSGTFCLAQVGRSDMPSFVSGRQSTRHFCTRTHVLEGLALNEQRKGVYAGLSNGRSLPVSRALISLERKILIGSFKADLSAFPYQLAGVPLLCAEYVSMSTLPAFQNFSTLPRPTIANFFLADLPAFRQKVRKALSDNDFSAILRISQDQLALLTKQSQFNCLLRHFVESIARAAALAPHQDRQAQASLRLSSIEVSKAFIWSHLLLLSSAQKIDLLAAPLQADGLPILCQDVPPIPIP